MTVLSWLTPGRAHAASLILGAVLLLVIGRDQWFFGDDWAILHPHPDLVANHQGHWNLVPGLLFLGMRTLVGLQSYLPYLALAVVAHLAVVHLVWRVCRRAGVRAWTATGLAASIVLLGCAAENLLWAFQVGFMGALAVGLGVLLLVDRPRPAVAAPVGAALLAIAALPLSGTALPVLAGAALLSLVRRGVWRTALVFAPAGIVYAAWYLASGGGAGSLAPSGSEWLTHAPLFFAAMFGAAYGQWTGLVVLGPIVAILLLVFVVRDRRAWTGRVAIAYAALAASVVFALLTTTSRAGGEVTAAGAQRYVYVVVVLAVPIVARALDSVLRRAGAWRVVVPAIVGIMAIVNAAFLVVRAGEQGERELRIARDVAAAVDVVAEHPEVPDGATPVPDGAPDLTVGDVRDAIAHDLLAPVDYASDSRVRVESALGLTR